MVSQSVTHRPCKTSSALGVQLVGKLAAAPQNPGGESVDDRRDERASYNDVNVYVYYKESGCFRPHTPPFTEKHDKICLADSWASKTSFGQVRQS